MDHETFEVDSYSDWVGPVPNDLAWFWDQSDMGPLIYHNLGHYAMEQANLIYVKWIWNQSMKARPG